MAGMRGRLAGLCGVVLCVAAVAPAGAQEAAGAPGGVQAGAPAPAGGGPVLGVRKQAARIRVTWDEIVARDRARGPDMPRAPVSRSPNTRPPRPTPVTERRPDAPVVPGEPWAGGVPDLHIGGVRVGAAGDGGERRTAGAGGPADGPCPGFIGDFALGENFQAIVDNGTFFPADTMGAMSRVHAVTMLNTEVAIQDRAGEVEHSRVALTSFWGPGLPGAFDPKVYYDDHPQRWIAAAGGNSQMASSMWALAVSDGVDPRAGWSFLEFDADAANTRWADYPCVGHNDKWVVVTFNMLMVPGATPAPTGTKMWVIDKVELLGTSPFVTFWEFDIGFVPSADTLQPAVHHDWDDPDVLMVDSSGWTNQAQTINYLRMSRVTGPRQNPAWEALPGSSTTTPGMFEAPHRFTLGSRTGAQLGSPTPLHLGNDRACNAVVRGNRLYFCHTGGLVFGGVPRDETRIYWYVLRPELPSPVIKSGHFGFSGEGTHVAYPSIAVNCSNDICIGYSKTSGAIYASSEYATHRGDGTQGGVAQHALANGGAPYVMVDPFGRNRWGDYSATVVDPRDTMSFWTIQKSATATANVWTTRWNQVPHNCTSGPTITQQPQSFAGCVGSDFTLFVGHNAGSSATYQWFKNSQPIPHYGNTLQVFGATPADTGAYQALVYNTCGATYTVAALVQIGTSILTHPRNWNVPPCETVEFEIDARGVGALQYQWFLRNDLGTNAIADDGHFQGATTDTLTIHGVRYDDEGEYFCRVTDPACPSPIPLNSAAGRLTMPANPAWAHRTTTGPVRRLNGDLVYDTRRRVSVMYGGYGPNGYMNETWEWDGVSWTRRFPPNNPGARSGHQMVWDNHREAVLLFGGSGVMPVNSQVWAYDGADWTLLNDGAGGPPPGHNFGEAAFNANLGKMVVIKQGATVHDTETWVFDSATASWSLGGVSQIGVNVYAFAALTFDPGLGQVLAQTYWLTAAEGNTWVLENMATWTEVPGALTPRRYWPVMAYDHLRKRSTIYGCCRTTGPGAYFTDTHAFSMFFMRWLPVLPDLHTTQTNAVVPTGMDFDRARRAMVLVGSAYDDHFASPVQTWEYRYLDTVAIDRQPADVELGAPAQDAVFAVAAAGHGTLTYQWRRNGVPLADGPTGTGSTIAGAATPTLTVQNPTSADSGLYRCQVSNACGSATTREARLACYANCDASSTPPQLNVADFSCFLSRYAAGDPYANCDGSTQPPVLNVQDFSCFLSRYAQGCP